MSVIGTYIDWAGSCEYLKSDLQRLWSWQLQDSELPPIHVAPVLPVMVAPHIPMRWQKMFMRHGFKVGGSKK